MANTHGGGEVSCLIDPSQIKALAREAASLPCLMLSAEQLCDLELLLSGAFTPLTGFFSQAEYERVCAEMRLPNGRLWPVPMTLDVTRDFAASLNEETSSISLIDAEGTPLAILRITDIFEPDRVQESESVFGCADLEHPGVYKLIHDTHPICLGGRVQGIQLPCHHDFQPLRHTPFSLRDCFNKRGWKKIVAFQTRNPMHKAHVELTLRAIRETGAQLLIHPAVGTTKPGDIDYFTRVRCYQAVLKHYAPGTAMLSLLPLNMRMAGPREALLHAIIRKNYGCTHFIVGRDHAGPGWNTKGEHFYEAYASQKMLQKYQDEIGIQMIGFREMVYLESEDRYLPEDEVPEGSRPLAISGRELRERLSKGCEIPEWFTFPDVAEVLRRTYRPRHCQGLTIFFTGLSGSGKTTLSNHLYAKFRERDRSVTVLDGDVVRRQLSSELGFSKAHRDINIRRIGFVASEITKCGGIAVCAPIAPYDATRKEVRSLIGQYGGFILVHLKTPLQICEQRDRKGLYAKARAGVIKDFTGISDPYEQPEDAEITIDTSQGEPEEHAQFILNYLEEHGYLASLKESPSPDRE